MKKKALCVFILLFWAVGVSTFLSGKVQEEMIPQVTILEPSIEERALPMDCLFLDETGMHLYSVYEGTGWEAGTRVREEDLSGCELGENGILVTGWNPYVQYASKPLTPGTLVEVKKSADKQPDHWLAVFPEEAPVLDQLPEGVSVAERNSHVVLLSLEEAQQPYMDGRAKSMIPSLEGAWVYSFQEMEQFLDCLAPLGLLAALLTAPVLLWACSCFMAREAGKNRVFLLVNLGVGLALTACVPLVLGAIDLPSSLLPREHITDLGFFAQEYSRFFQALTSFAPPASATGPLAPNLPQSPAGQAIIHYRNSLLMRPVLWMSLGFVFPLLVILTERGIMIWRNRPKIQ